MHNYTCPNCGTPVSEYDTICPNCGTPLDQNLTQYGNQSKALNPRDKREKTHTNHQVPFDKPNLDQDPHATKYNTALPAWRLILIGILIIGVLGWLIMYIINE